jgi:hypothetical protein
MILIIIWVKYKSLKEDANYNLENQLIDNIIYYIILYYIYYTWLLIFFRNKKYRSFKRSFK